jgi:TonB family protein
MKQMFFLSTGVHFFFFVLLFAFHFVHLQHAKIKPRILSVQLVTLQKTPLEEKKEPLPEPVKKVETAPLPKSRKKSVPLPKAILKPAPPAKRSLPSLPLSPVQPKTMETPPPVVEAKKEEAAPVVEPQKVEIAQISTIDPDYIGRVKGKVESNWNPPPFTGQEKQVTISFDILRSGQVKSPKIIKSSGDPDFDRAALRAVYEARNVGPLPADYPKLLAEITCSFSQNKGS